MYKHWMQSLALCLLFVHKRQYCVTGVTRFNGELFEIRTCKQPKCVGSCLYLFRYRYYLHL